MRSSSRTGPLADERSSLLEEKRGRLEDLVGAYERILAVTASGDVANLTRCFRRAEEITGRLRDLDARLERATPVKEDPATLPALRAIGERLQVLNRRITEEIERHLGDVRREVDRVRALKRVVARYRPYRETSGRRLDRRA